MEEELTSFQISEWEAYDHIDPIGTWRDDFRTASLASLITNIVLHLYSEKGKTPKILTALDFMPDWTGEREKESMKQDTESMKQMLLEMAERQNKKIERDKRQDKPPKSKK